MRNKIDKILEWMLCIILGAMVIDVVWQVVSRYVVANPSTFTDELASFLLIWLGILGGAYVYGKGEHLAINFVVGKFSPSTQKWIKLSVESVILLFSLTVMVIGGVWMVYTRFILDVRSAALQINWGYVYMVLPISGVMICYYAMGNIRKLLTNKE